MTVTLPNECFGNILIFLDIKTLYKCLFINRYFCKLSIPIIWRDPFILTNSKKSCNRIPLINTLLACLDEDEVSSLIPCVIKFNNKTPLFEYGEFIKKIDHKRIIECIITWLEETNGRNFLSLIEKSNYGVEPNYEKDCRVRKLIDAIYHMIMRKSSSLQEFIIIISENYINLPKPSIFTTYQPGISNLRSLNITNSLNFINDNDTKYHNIMEFLIMVSKFCNCIISSHTCVSSLKIIFKISEIVKLQPLKRISINNCNFNNRNVEYSRKILYNLKFRSETLKELIFDSFNFRLIDISFILELKNLEYLEFNQCVFFYQQFLNKEKLQLKELKLVNCETPSTKAIIESLCNETLVKLTLNIEDVGTAIAIKEYCSNINILNAKFPSYLFFDLIVPHICELSSLKILSIYFIEYRGNYKDQLIKMFGDYLVKVDYLFLNFDIELSSFEYFINNCKANLKKLILTINNDSLRKDYLLCVNNFQNVHNSLKVLEIKKYGKEFCWTREEIKIIDLLKNQDIITFLSYE
ncbi:hypothetical protein C1645_877731 [Glomus cerebriforme]|uniref:F-box domain-containing protein n=1 Tax=Glomus cerebriforme TaxID=658196 RepID=A0A397SVQ5_9GLOM|nr:hypothetical protein C1645_877731 [Glomus cerebriforme]